EPNSLDDRILAAACGIGRSVDGSLDVFHGFDVSSALAVAPETLNTPIMAPVRELKAALMQRHTEAVHALTDRHGFERRSVHIHEGPIRRLLVAWTRELEVDLLVVGGASRSTLPHLSVGSTAE